MYIQSFLVAMACFAQNAWAQSTPPEIPKTTEQATAQRARAESLRAQAEKRYGEEQNACRGKFLLTDCLDETAKTHSRLMIESRTLENGVRSFEREEHKHAVEIKATQHQAELANRDAEQQAQAEHYRDEEANKASVREHNLAEKAKKAEAGRQKTEAEQAARREKQAKRAKQDAEREAKKAAHSGAAPL